MCPVCGGEKHDVRLTAGLMLRRCRTCRLWTSDIPHGTGTSYATVDDVAYLHSIGTVRRAQAAEIVAFTRAHVNGGEWLDVGCGYGFVLEAAEEAGFRVRGIEPDAKAARVAHDRVGNVEEGLLDDATPPSDVLSTLDVLEHLEDIDAFAQLVRRKARAFWLIKVPSSDGLFFRVAHALHLRSAVHRLWQSGYAHPHTIYFDEKTLTRFLEPRGFEVIATRYLDEIPNGTIVARLTLDGRMSRTKALLAVPLVAAINLLGRWRRKTDALVMLARVK